MPKVYLAPHEMCIKLKLEVRRIQDCYVVDGWPPVTAPDAADTAVCPTCAGWDRLQQNPDIEIPAQRVRSRLLKVMAQLQDAAAP